MIEQDILQVLDTSVSPKRKAHILGVAQTARQLAQRHSADPQKAYLAGLLHDLARGLDGEEALQQAHRYGIAVDAYTQAHPEILHGPIAAAWAHEKWGINDQSLLHAVCQHTLGGVPMDTLSRILYLSDAIEPNRDYPGVDALRALAQRDLHAALCASMEQSIAYLRDRRLPPHPTTLAALKALKNEEEFA